MSDELSFAIKLFQALEAYIPWQSMVLLSHVPHEEFVAGELFVTTLALHVLRLFEEVQIAQNELKFGWREKMSILFRFQIVNVIS